MSRTNHISATETLMAKWDSREHWLKNAQFEVNYLELKPNNTPKFHCYFFHGTGNDLHYPNLDLFDALLSAGIQVTTFDLPGHGKKSKGYFDVEYFEEYITLLKNHVIKSNTQNRINFFFCGYSIGCTYANNLGQLFDAPVIEIAAPSTLSLLRLWLPFYEIFGFFKAYSQTKFFHFWGFIPAILWFGRKKFPIRLQSGGIIDTVSKISKKSLKPHKKLQIFGKYDLISPLPPESHDAKIYNAAHFDLIFHRIMFSDIIGFIHECFTKN